MSQTMVCDFCSDPSPAWSFDCKNHEVPGTYTTSVGAWLACEMCAILIRQEAWHSLAVRSCEKTGNGRMMMSLTSKTAAVRYVEEMHKSFRANANGKSQLLKKENP